jgi:hypothetical protein
MPGFSKFAGLSNVSSAGLAAGAGFSQIAGLSGDGSVVVPVWDPSELFASGEQGAWYDPSDFSTMFQDSAGTTPVTAVEQNVGLILDKSKGAGYAGGSFTGTGPELVSNGTFDTDTTGWASSQSATLSVVSGRIRITKNGSNNGGATQTITLVAGKNYLIKASLFLGTHNRGSFSVSNVTPAISTDTIDSNANYQFIVQATAASAVVTIRNGGSAQVDGTYVEYDNVSVVELPGNHATQSTSGSRPVLRARYNLLTYSEQFDNAAWDKFNFNAFGSGSVANTTATVDPLGGNTADYLQEDSTTGIHLIRQAPQVGANVQTIASVFMKAAERTLALIYTETPIGEGGGVWFDLANGTVGTQGSGRVGEITSVGNGWYLCSVISTVNTAEHRIFIGPALTDNAVSYAGDGASGIYIWGADLRVTNDGVGLPAYQRIAAATDYDTVGFPPYLQFDGSDDFLVTGSINPGAVDKAQVFAGVRKLSDAVNYGCVAETSEISGLNNGALSVFAPGGGANYYMESRGDTAASAELANSWPAPISTVLSSLSDISGDSLKARVNGVQEASITTNQGAGNYASHALYIGRRAGASLPFNGRLYGLILRFSAANLDAGVIDSAEAWMNGKTGAY